VNIEEIELILNTGSRYITNNEKSHILDYIEYLKTKNNVVENKNIELVIKIERLNNIINEVREYNEEILKESWYGGNEKNYAKHNLEILDKGEDK